ncbi:ribonuclease HI [Maribellus maritimus]|uniref:ribonuclease HI n=1 Tax=Maribellus maritimus TaxID=2870838 RepID=UPI001EEBF462|nr:RNase H family protein [Maribellus maritimus]MCG6190550.1 hypothetical protein [Maribellus maritimus]
MAKLLLFTDGSVHIQSGIGYGAFLFVSEEEQSIDKLKEKVQVKRFEETSSTKLELQIFLFALNTIKEDVDELFVYSDSQNLAELMERRQRLEKNDFHSKTGKILKNAVLYRAFFAAVDRLKIRFIKVKGHKPSREKNTIDRIFTLVDRTSRRSLREEIKM